MVQTLMDYEGKSWSLNQKLFEGGFGTIYSCAENERVVIKIQRVSEKQLRKEEKFYLDFKNRTSKYIPSLITSGIDNSLRFIIIEKFPFDLDMFLKHIKLTKREKCDMAYQVLLAIRFIHSFGYSHCDIKAKNILVRFETGRISLYITDFGLCYKFMKNNRHVPYKPRQLCLHRGTLPFMSEDSHLGVVPSRRSDLENIGWFFIYTLFDGILPWHKTSNKKSVLKIKQLVKRTIRDNDEEYIKTMLSGQSHKRLFKYLSNVVNLTYEQEPDYNTLEDIFSESIKITESSSF